MPRPTEPAHQIAPARSAADAASGGPPSDIAARALASRQAKAASYLEGLNPEQREAVETLEGPLLVLAGAGTGKTRVLTTRIAHILATGQAWPSQILAVTFTNKAAREMKERIGRYVGEQVEGMPWLGTFHSIAAKILRRHAELVGLKSSFSILDTDDQIRLLKQLIRAEGIDDKRWPPRLFAGLVDQWKNKGLSPEQISEGDARSFADGRGRELYRQYQDRLKVLNAVDFGDLLVENIRLFRENPDVLAEYQNRFRFMLVDEYQDTNVAQYLWLRLLAQRSGIAEGDLERKTNTPPNICCVGDDDQSIYGWRGAEVDNILRFEKDFPGAKVIRLERNYRSTAHILGAASHLISHNEGRLGKTLFTDAADAGDVKVMIAACWDSEEEARQVGEEIEQLQRQDHALNDMAILVRASFQMREFEDRFVTLGLNYRVIGGPRFYERLEIRDAMAYFRVVCQPADDLAFERIVNTPKRGIGEATLRIIHDHARKQGIPLSSAVRELVETEEFKPKVRATLASLMDDFSRWADQLDATSHTELAETILEESGYTEMWQNDRAPEAPGRLDNLKELIRSMEEFENMRGFLEHVSLVMDTEQNEDLDAVSLMTLHSAKGLEFDTVFLPGWEEGLFPHQRSLDEGGRSGLEEERRLAYVGITRARERCTIYFTSNRRVHGLWQNSIPSRFIDELPEAHVEVLEPSSSYGGYGSNRVGGGYGASRFDTSDPFTSSYSSPGWQRAQRGNARRAASAQGDPVKSNWGSRSGAQVAEDGGRNRRGGGRVIDGELVAASINQPSSGFSVGDRVFHLKFGNGNIAAIDGNKLTIDFDKAGQKKVLDSFVEGV
ncbi:ATP-dependent helicase [Salaquimonas pukyongi]|uniref:ATP-dependent helicase n=1 Tax=Salaquimonas pukyongi TaxID=2712698 RepID=UPI00096BB16E|nr:UvrD-helicase domain-containing protein [Salaquimonas pukyongi]